MKILFLSTWFPYPPDNGSRIRVYNLLKQLSRKHDVSLLSFFSADRGEVASELDGLCSSVETVPWIPYSPTSTRAWLGFFSPTPRSIVDSYSPAMAQAVRAKLISQDYDLILASQIDTALYVPRSLLISSVLDEVQTSVIRDAAFQSRPLLQRFRKQLTWIKFRQYVVRLLQRFDACTVVSRQEQANIREIAPDYSQVHVIPNGVDLEHYKMEHQDVVPDSLIYTGALTYDANYDAIVYFLNSIMPLVQAEIPGAELKVTGSTHGVALDKLPLTDRTILTGYLEDVRPAIARSWACVVPLRIGGGTRLKVLEALALGTPVVSTPKGVEGLEVTPEENILIADEPSGFAAQVIRLLGDPALRQRLAENGRKLVEQKYGWAQIGFEFDALLEEVARAQKPQ